MKNIVKSVVIVLVSLAAVRAAELEEDAFSLFAAEIQRAKKAAGEESSVSKMPEGIGRVADTTPALKKPVVVENDSVAERKPVEKESVNPEKNPVDIEKLAEKSAGIKMPVADPVEVEKPSSGGAAEVQELLDALSNESTGKTAPVEKPVEKPVEVRVPVTNTVEKIVEKKVVVEKPVEVEKIVIVERTNVVEKIVVDKTREEELLERERQLLDRQKELQEDKDRLAKDKKQLTEDNLRLSGEKEKLAKEVEAVQERNQEMVASSAALGEELSKERDRRQRLERVIPKENRQFADNFLRITAPTTFYDRKEGYAVFQGGVHVRDNEYELHSKRAFVFNDPVSNTVSRIVALENVAVTNGAQRAYGVKASYYRRTGMVILYGDENTPAVLRDESKVDDQEIVGSKIKFWLNSQQIEVQKARIKAPVGDVGDLTKDLPR